jgi:hypothetical protein
MLLFSCDLAPLPSLRSKSNARESPNESVRAICHTAPEAKGRILQPPPCGLPIPSRQVRFLLLFHLRTQRQGPVLLLLCELCVLSRQILFSRPDLLNRHASPSAHAGAN